MSLFRLKQPFYGGYSDKPVCDNSGGMKVSVSFGGTGAGMAVEYGK